MPLLKYLFYFPTNIILSFPQKLISYSSSIDLATFGTSKYNAPCAERPADSVASSCCESSATHDWSAFALSAKHSQLSMVDIVWSESDMFSNFNSNLQNSQPSLGFVNSLSDFHFSAEINVIFKSSVSATSPTLNLFVCSSVPPPDSVVLELLPDELVFSLFHLFLQMH